MSAPIQGFAEHTIWHEIIMFQLCCKERWRPLCHRVAPSWLSVLHADIWETTAKPSGHGQIVFLQGLFKLAQAFIISIPLNDSLYGCFSKLIGIIIVFVAGTLKL